MALVRRPGAAVDPADYLCGPTECPLTIEGRFLFKDRSHYRASLVVDDRFKFLDRLILGA